MSQPDLKEDHDEIFLSNDSNIGMIGRRYEQPLLRSISDFGFRSNRQEIVARQLLYEHRPKLSNRTRHISLNQNLVNTEREPILLNEKSNKTIFVQGFNDWRY